MRQWKKPWYWLNFASEVTVVHRRDNFRASKIMQERVLSHPKIKVKFNTEIAEITGGQKWKV